MSNNIEIVSYNKGRVPLNSKIRKNYGIEEGDMFLVDLDEDKLTFTKIDKDKLKNLKGK